MADDALEMATVKRALTGVDVVTQALGVSAGLEIILPPTRFFSRVDGLRRTVRFLRRHEHGRGQAPSFGGVAETFDARNRGARVQAMDI